MTISASKLALLHSVVLATNSAAGFIAIEGTPDARELQGEGLIEVRTDLPDLQPGHAAARATPAGIQMAEAHPQNGQTGTNGADWGSTQTNAPTNFGDAAAQANQTAQTQTTAQTSTGPAFVPVSGVGFTPSAPAKREGVKRDAPEKYPFGELKAPTVNPDGSINYAGAVVFVPSTKDKTGKLRTGDEMAFSLMSACAAAARRYGKELPAKANSRGKMIKQYELDRKFATQAANDGSGPNGQTGAYIYRMHLTPEQSAA